LLPANRIHIFSPREGQILKFNVNPNEAVGKNQVLIEMFDPTLQRELVDLDSKIGKARESMTTIRFTLSQNPNSQDKSRLQSELTEQTKSLDMYNAERAALAKQFTLGGKPGLFQIMSPKTLSGRQMQVGQQDWLVLSGSDIRDLTGRFVKPSEPLLRIGQVTGEWEAELKIPQKNIGQVKAAFKTNNPDEELDVDLKLSNMVTKTYKGKLAQRSVSPEAVPNKDDHNESDPVVYAWVRVSGEGIAEEDQVPLQNSLAGVEVKAKIRCGPHAMGYSLFYGVWEYACDKLFWLF
jgi:multidrug efflux pump subunit AcrA (membrane-fusion protein)